MQSKQSGYIENQRKNQRTIDAFKILTSKSLNNHWLLNPVPWQARFTKNGMTLLCTSNNMLFVSTPDFIMLSSALQTNPSTHIRSTENVWPNDDDSRNGISKNSCSLLLLIHTLESYRKIFWMRRNKQRCGRNYTTKMTFINFFGKISLKVSNLVQNNTRIFQFKLLNLNTYFYF